MLLAADSRLISINPNDGSLLENGQVLSAAPTHFTFNFEDSAVLTATEIKSQISIRRSGKDGIFTNGNEVIITPGFIGVGDSSNQAIVRFAETLPDDVYQIEAYGITTQFRLDLGAKITAIVPQPVQLNEDGHTQSRNQIEVYFNDDELDRSSAEDPGFYQLIHTADTVTNTDDTSFRPTLVDYDSITNRVTLTFASDIDQLVAGTVGTFRLRIGTDEPIATSFLPPERVFVGSDPGSNFNTAMNLDLLDKTGKLLTTDIDIEEFPLDYPGDNDSPGHRELTYHSREQHITDARDALFNPTVTPVKDVEAGVSTIAYMFRDVYGFDPMNGAPFRNLITEPQKQRVREIASLYSYYAGIQFYEADQDVLEDLLDQGVTVFSVATGDLRALDPEVPTGPGGVIGIAGGLLDPTVGAIGAVIPTAIMDGAEVWDDAYGAEETGQVVSWFRTAMHEIGHLLGMGHTYDLSPGTIMGETFELGFTPEPVFPGNHDIVHTQHLHRPESTDIDLYKFDLESTGLFAVETFAQRRANAEFLDTVISVYKQDISGNRTLIARNDDYYSNDSFVELTLGPGTYFVGISAAGNDKFDANVANGGSGGRSQGTYDLRLNFRPLVTSTIVDATGTAFDGDDDGNPGGIHNFWFRANSTENTVFVDKAAANGGDGSLGTPYNNLGTAVAAAGQKANLEKTNVTVRVLGNGGSDGLLETLEDNKAYEIGFNRSNQRLQDGATLEVPANVTVMIDEGAVFKLRRARIGVGSSTPSVDRSKTGLQVLGTPEHSVVFTSYADEAIGVDTNPLPTSPNPGDWGGILFQNEVDRSVGRFEYEQNGIFINYVNHADVRYGGGEVVIDSIQQIITPIQMVEARPTVSHNVISRSADAGLSADPNSFEETNFHAPIYQSTLFTSDYSRIGPDIHDNQLNDNSINGLFVRIKTPAGNSVRAMTVSGRWNDKDIVHVVSENLVVQGQVGGPEHALLRSPAASGVRLTPGSLGGLPEGDFSYRFTFAFADGREGPASATTIPVSVLGRGIQGTVALTNLPRPSDTTNIVGLRIYRSAASGTTPYTLVDQIPIGQRQYIDNGTVFSSVVLQETATSLNARLDARLSIDPSVVVKLDSAHIEVSFGGDFLAESGDGFETIFTSLRDDRFGAGATFDTNNDNNFNRTDPEPGDWGGIYVGPTSSASIDHGFFAFGGGVTTIDGSFAAFNTIEIHQAKTRITNTKFISNADGTGGQASSDRFGFGFNASGTIFIRGAQPVVVGNTIQDNEGAALNTNPNALNADLVADFGRSTGPIDLIEDYGDNQGALIRNNSIGGNAINGMIVRGEVLSTESVWDDTDVVHVVLEEILVPDFHEFGGLRLESSATSSLVVKLNGGSAGFTASGNELDNDDRIGGSLRIVGQPGFPVVLTSIRDDSIGAGTDTNGRSQNDTDNNGNRFDAGGSLPRGPEVNNGTLIDNDVLIPTPGFLSINVGNGGDSLLGAATIQTQAQVLQNQNVITLFSNFVNDGTNIFNLGATNITLPPTLIADDVVASEGTFVVGVVPNEKTIRWRVETSLEDGDPTIFNKIRLTTTEDDETLGNLQIINMLDQDIAGPAGDILVSRGIPGDDNFRAFVFDDVERLGFGHGGIYDRGEGLVNASFRGWTADIAGVLLGNILAGTAAFSVIGAINQVNLPLINDPELGDVYGPQDVATAFSWSVDGGARTSTITSFIELIPRNPSSLAGDWRGVRIDEFAHDRNVDIATEQEPTNANAPGINSIPDRAQFLGELAPFERGGDDNRRLGFEVHGYLNATDDVDVYSFRGVAGTEVWMDLDSTTVGLDSVIELVDANGTVLARSDNSYAESLDSSTLFGIAKPMVRSVFDEPDRYTVNIHDAGMRVELPGGNGSINTYHVRVRSAGTDMDDLSSGISSGAYKMQIRLREIDEIPGSTVQFADIRNAVTGIEILGQPAHSPLLGEAGETTIPNDLRANAQNLGNVLATDRGALVLQGNFESSTDIDWYQFEARLEGVQRVGPDDPNNPEYVAVTFDVDFTDGFGRPDTTLWLFDIDGRLIYSSHDSSIEDDRPTASGSATLNDLQAGSVGAADAYLGTVELQEGTYFLAMANARAVPNALDQINIRTEPVNSLIRVAEDRVLTSGGSNIAAGPTVPILFTDDFSIIPPNESSDIVDGEVFIITNPDGDAVTFELDSNGAVSGTNIAVPFDPVLGTAFSLSSTMQGIIGANAPAGVTVGFGTTSAFEVVLVNAIGVRTLPAPGQGKSALYVSKPSNTPFRLGDVTLFVTVDSGRDQSRLITIDPYTGAQENTIGIFGQNIEDLAIRPNNGLLYGYTVPEQMPSDGNSGNLISIDHQSLTQTNLSNIVGDDTITTFWVDPAANVGGGGPATPANLNDGVQFDAIALGGGIREELTGFAVGHRGGYDPTALPGGINGVQGPTKNLLYEFNPDTGAAFSLEGPDPVDRQDVEVLEGGGTQIRERGQLDLLSDPNPDNPGGLIAVEATTAGVDETVANIVDGLQFVVDDGQTLTTFEMNSGPEVRFTYAPPPPPDNFGNQANGFFVRDGVTFRLDGESFEFDTGATLIVNAQRGDCGENITCLIGVDDGNTFTITEDSEFATTFTFEFDTGDGVRNGNVRVGFQENTTTPDQLAQSIISSINNSRSVSLVASLLANTRRITLTGELEAASQTPGLAVEGMQGVSDDATAIPVEENMTALEFGEAIDISVPGASADGDRINFSGWVTGQFAQVAGLGVFTPDTTADGNVSAGTIGIDFEAADTAAEVAFRLAEAISTAGLQVTASSQFNAVVLTGGSIVSADPPFTIGGSAPGGIINGIAIVNGDIYAVTAEDPLDPAGGIGGGLYRIRGNGPNSALTNNALADYIETSIDLLTGGRDFLGNPTGGPIQFAALEPGPDNLDNGRYAEMLFGMDLFGNMYAFDLGGRLQPVFQDSNVSVATGIFNATGFAFSTLDMNLWHVTNQRREDDGHGVVEAPDRSRRAEADAGNVSLHFGFENPARTPGNWANTNDPGIRDSYAFPGGAHGSIESNTFDLSEYSPLDRPTLYFNYFLDTEEAIGDVAPPPFMRDSFRVFVSSDNGEWELVGTNNEFRGNLDADDEFDYSGLVDVQELVDNVGWREMRVDLAPFAGSDNVRLRFDFNSAGSLDLGNPFTGGDEIRAVEATKISDGDTMRLTSSGFFGGIDTFEFDFGHMILAPTGAGIVDGSTIIVNDGVNNDVVLEFDLGNGVSNASIPIAYDKGMTSEEVAKSIQASLGIAYGNGIAQIDLSLEQNDIIPEAQRSALRAGTIVATGTIGDNPTLFGTDRGKDVDIIEVVLQADQRIVIDVNTDATSLSSLADSYVRLFSADGLQVAENDDENFGTLDSLLDVTVGQAGIYYIGISGSNNSDYSPNVVGSGVSGAMGDYRVDVRIFGDIDSPIKTHRNGGILELDEIASFIPSFDSGILFLGTPGVDSINFPINLDINMSDDDVAYAVRRGIAEAYGSGDPEGIPGYGDVIQLVGHQVVIDDFFNPSAGPLGLTVTGFFDDDPLIFDDFNGLDGDLFGAFYASTNLDGTTDVDNPGFLRGLNNDFEGVYIDDIVIGFTERGEMYTTAEPDDTFRILPLNEIGVEILTGDYQLEIRPSQSYGIYPNGDEVIKIVLTEAFDPRDRLADAVTMTVSAGAEIADGATIIVSDGDGSVELEFDDINIGNGISPGRVPVRYTAADSAAEVANALAAVINSSLVQNVADVSANSPVGSNRVELFGNAIIDTSVGLTTSNVAEENDTLAVAEETNIASDDGIRFIGNGAIGDNLKVGAGLDVDFFRFELDAGERVLVDVDSVDAPFDAVLRLFNASGSEVAVSDDDPGPGELPSREPFISFTATTGGTYYVGVSGFSNSVYDPNVVGSGITGNTGKYKIDISVGGTNEIVEVTVEKGYGDRNPFREQGQLIVHSTRVTNSSQFGILVDEGTRLAPDDFPHQGTPRVLFNTNIERLFTGVTIKNNLVAYNREGAIHYSGDPSIIDQVQGPVSFGRIINNTLVGGQPFQISEFQDDSPIGRGILVDENSSPTILNNIIVNFEMGIDVDLTSQSTVIGGTLYQDNIANSNKGLGDKAIILADGDTLFVNRDAGNFYLAEGSIAIDSSVSSLRDRDAMVFVSSPLGVPVSPILAPDFDITGLLRVDDPAVNTPAGQGENVFKDRGAIDRADFIGPTAILTRPGDNAVGDLNPNSNTVLINNPVLRNFQIQLRDGLTEAGLQRGAGVDRLSVLSSSVSVTQNNVVLVEGIDYLFSYETSNNTITLTPLSGVWQPGRVYQVILDNSEENGIRDLANNFLQPNAGSGQTIFTISIGGENQDFGDAPANYPTLLLDNGASHVIESGFFLGSTIDSEPNGLPSPNADGDGSSDDGIEFSGFLFPGGTTTVLVTASRAGFLDAWIDFNRDGDWNDGGEQVVTSQPISQGVDNVDIQVPADAPFGTTFARFRLSHEGGLFPTGLALNGEVEDYQVDIVSRTPWQNTTRAFDVNSDGAVVPRDVLIIINELNNPTISDPTTGRLPNPPTGPNTPDNNRPGYVDVDGNGFVSPRDALLIINFLNQGGEGEFGSMNSLAIVGASIEDADIQAALEFPAEIVVEDVDQIVAQNDDDDRDAKMKHQLAQTSLDGIFESSDADLLFEDLANDVASYWDADDERFNI